MPEIPMQWLLSGNEYWISDRAVNEIEMYCDLLDNLQEKVDALETRGKDEESALANAQSVLSSYALEIAMKSLWALDNSHKKVPHKHDLSIIFNGLKEETVKSLERLQLTREVLELSPKPFYSNRYSMEDSIKSFTVYPTRLLRPLNQLLRDKLEELSGPGVLDRIRAELERKEREDADS